MAWSAEGLLEMREDASHEIDRLGQIPVELRDFTITLPDAEKQFGLTRFTLQALAAAGLPHQGEADAARFAEADLAYLGVHLGTARAHLTKFALIAKSLTRFAEHGPVRLMVNYIPLLASGTEPVAGAIALPEGGRREVDLVHNKVAVELSTVTLGSAYPRTPTKLVEALAEAGSLNLYALPAELLGDVAFSRRTGLSECFTAAQMVVECCRGAGYEARVSEGLLVSIPWSSAHYWAEACVDGDWLPLDPLMIRAMQRFGSLDAQAWPTHRSLAPILARFPAGSFPLVTARADGARVEARLLTSVHQAS